MTNDNLLLSPFELSNLPSNEWIDGRWYYDPYEIMRALLAKVINHRLDRPERRGKIKEMVLRGDSMDVFVEGVLVLFPDEGEIRESERERIMKVFASFGKIQLEKPLSGKEFEALFD